MKISDGTPEQIALYRARNRRKYHKHAAKQRAAALPNPAPQSLATPAAAPTTPAPRRAELSDKLERQVCGMIAAGHSFADIEACDQTMPAAAQIALWATNEKDNPRFVARYRRAQIAWNEQQLMALRAESKVAKGKTKIDAIRYDLTRLERQIADAGGKSASETFTDQAPAWLRATIATALTGLSALRTTPHIDDTAE